LVKVDESFRAFNVVGEGGFRGVGFGFVIRIVGVCILAVGRSRVARVVARHLNTSPRRNATICEEIGERERESRRVTWVDFSPVLLTLTRVHTFYIYYNKENRWCYNRLFTDLESSQEHVLESCFPHTVRVGKNENASI
jgi:hypothetical protein